ncbi:ABC transporter ATP-binding protein [Hoeflea sp.]|uniref:ABC transporter ATP-binding protein n=1 Tax=Hoeflea sp. TaxID=1940281 RepID=UPI00198E039E|nr:ABC transporter ATP-binding protein [Hoeflea sp.]MBC7284229.1 ABC transporter ATP-binding protein [Hoeflea sp.]
MSYDIGVDVKGLGKVYNLFDRDTAQLACVLFGREAENQVWALRDVGLSARAGDFIGIIGRNGAGKSTLLEIIAGTRQPSVGSVSIRGRVAAMLELGAGFNPNFTGTENARLCASAYGLSNSQIRERLPDIARFAGIEEFMDRPTREFSSGMFARLAFSVCAHVDADILIVDEILGVGDVQFQQRSMRFLRAFSRDRIVFLASHNETAIPSLCNRAILLSNGRIALTGRPKDVAYAYLKSVSHELGQADGFEAEGDLSGSDADAVHEQDETPAPSLTDFDALGTPGRPGSLKVAALSCDGAAISTLSGGELVCLSISFETQPQQDAAVLAFVVRDPLGQAVVYREMPAAMATGPGGAPLLEARFEFVMPYLASGAYVVDIALIARGGSEAGLIDRRDLAVAFTMISGHISSGLANLGQLSARICVLDPAS